MFEAQARPPLTVDDLRALVGELADLDLHGLGDARRVELIGELESLKGAAAAVQAFLGDLHSGNCPAAYALVVDPLRTRAGSSGGLCSGQMVTGTYTVGAMTALTSSSAFVTVTVANAGQTTTETITVLYQSPSWYVSDVVGQGSATPGPGEVSIAHLVGIIEQQYQSMNGASATVTCPQEGTIQSTPGQRFRCTFSDTRGRSGSLTVNIRSTGGGFSWSIP